MPRTLSAYEGARLTGMTAAQEEHQRLGTTMHERVPVFDVIEDARIWLFFQPMRTLYGAYERHGDAAGIIINSQHPLSLQRFTAGHEYGHHVLGPRGERGRRRADISRRTARACRRWRRRRSPGSSSCRSSLSTTPCARWGWPANARP